MQFPTKNEKNVIIFKTRYPFIDAGMRQLYKEGWVHHIVRNALSCFLTRGDLWISWEPGKKTKTNSKMTFFHFYFWYMIFQLFINSKTFINWGTNFFRRTAQTIFIKICNFFQLFCFLISRVIFFVFPMQAFNCSWSTSWTLTGRSAQETGCGYRAQPSKTWEQSISHINAKKTFFI